MRSDVHFRRFGLAGSAVGLLICAMTASGCAHHAVRPVATPPPLSSEADRQKITNTFKQGYAAMQSRNKAAIAGEQQALTAVENNPKMTPAEKKHNEEFLNAIIQSRHSKLLGTR